MYAAGGGAGSSVVDRTVCTQPSSPAAHGVPGRDEAGVEPAGVADLHRDAAVVDVRGDGSTASATRRATGFSQNTGRPASTPARISCGVGVGGGGDDHAVDAGGQQRRPASRRPSAPNRSATASVTAGTASVTTRESTRGQRGQGLGVEGADPAESDQSETHVSSRCLRDQCSSPCRR